jgi:SSS family transporter
MEYIAKNWVILIIMLVYTAFCLLIGQWFKKKAARDVDAFYVAKREIPGWAISLAFFSTFISTNTYVGQAGFSFQAGLSWVWVGVYWVVFCMISWLLMGPRMRVQTAKLKSVTIPDYFDYRYKSSFSKAIRIFAAAIILFATLWYMTAIAKGCAHLLKSTLGVPYAWGAFLVIFITTLYSVLGGMYSVLWTDAVQGLIMFFVAIFMVMIPAMYVGGWEPLMNSIAHTTHLTAKGQPIGNGLMTFCTLVSFAYITSIGLAVGMKQIAEPRCLIRFYSIDNAKSMKFAMIATPLFLGISLACVFAVGALVHGMATGQEATYLIKHTDEVIGFMLAKFGNPWATGFVMAGLFAAGMSSFAAVSIIVGTAFVGDIWAVIKPLSQQKQVSYTKWLMWIYSGIVFILALYPPAGIVELTAFSGAVFTAGFFPAVFGGLFLRWGTGKGALYSMIIGIAMTVFWRFSLRFALPGMKDIHEIIPGFIVSLIVYLIVSKLTASDMPNKEHLDHVFHTQAS